jgi:hypothetical protein
MRSLAGRPGSGRDFIHLLGEENEGFTYLTSDPAQDRLSIAVNSQAAATAVLNWTIEEVRGTHPGHEVKSNCTALSCKLAAWNAQSHLNETSNTYNQRPCTTQRPHSP